MKFKVTVSQWVQEMADKVFEADSQEEATTMALEWNEQTSEWDWCDGDSIRDFEVIEVEEVE